MAFTQEQLTALEQAYALGVTEITYKEGNSTTTTKYQSMNEMRVAINRIRNELAMDAILNSPDKSTRPPNIARFKRSAMNGL
jgi:hypothetical protein